MEREIDIKLSQSINNNISNDINSNNNNTFQNNPDEEYKVLSNIERDNEFFINKLQIFKNKISIIKKDFSDYYLEINKREKLSLQQDKSAKKINDILNQNTGKVTLNVGGEEYQVSLSTLKSRRNTLFYKQILRGVIKNNNTVFYDRDPKHFNTILSFLRSGKLSINNYNEEDKNELLNESMFYEVNYIIEILKNTNTNFEISEVKISNPFKYKENYICNTLVTCLNKNKKLDKGFVSDKNGSVVIKFNKDITATEMMIAGYNGNSDSWFVGNGKGALIHIGKENNKNSSEKTLIWEFVSIVPNEYGHEILNIKFKNKMTFRYLKFVCADFFGIGYLDFKMA